MLNRSELKIGAGQQRTLGYYPDCPIGNEGYAIKAK